VKKKCKMQSAKCKMQNDKDGKENRGCDDNQAPAVCVATDLSERLLGFAVRVGKVVNALPRTRLGRHVAAQLIRSGTSAAPNYEEGCAAESRADFVHKLSVSLKELRESRFWIRLIVKSALLPTKKMTDLEDECTQLCRIIAKSLITAKKSEGDARP
jgi:four helix bundle protein